ncbi:NIL domain-containing protein [Desulfogranum mediterraneum]|uniref:NIL domain-containing protein n=1 Tax=Desulfogranum mediterraneum TaxID=160661 RepID=UPI00040194A3|nr:NIL domain-containing protein [Desulfogranum mediterraneum]
MITKKVYLYFPKSETEKPIVCELIRNFDLTINIFRAKVTPEEEGYLSLEITGTEEHLEQAYEFLKGFDVVIHAGSKAVHWDSERCTHCGNCLTHCPTGALHLADQATRTVAFTEEKCIECLSCITNCPFGVCTSAF